MLSDSEGPNKLTANMLSEIRTMPSDVPTMLTKGPTMLTDPYHAFRGRYHAPALRAKGPYHALKGPAMLHCQTVPPCSQRAEVPDRLSFPIMLSEILTMLSEVPGMLSGGLTML